MSGTIEQLRKLTAIMFTDIVGYTALSHRTESLALELLEEHRQLLRPIFNKYGGVEIKTIGDAFLVQFTSAVQAAECAIRIQTAMRAHTSVVGPERQTRLRIGLHVGDVVASGEDLLGDGVNIASRIEPLAEPEGICVSEAVAQQIENKIDLPLKPLGEKVLKGIQTPVTIYRIALPWEDDESEQSHPSQGFRKRSKFWIASIGGAIILIALGIIWWQFGPRQASVKPGSIASLAVLPLENLTNDSNQEYFVDSLHDALITQLSKISALSVRSRQSVVQYKGSEKSLPQIGNE